MVAGATRFSRRRPGGKDLASLVTGASAGGLEVLDQLIGQLPTDLPATMSIVQHMAPENLGGALLHALGKHKAFVCKLASDGEAFEKGRIYIPPPGYHLLVKQKAVLVTKGAQKNRYRPAIDPLFRSAAVMHGRALSEWCSGGSAGRPGSNSPIVDWRISGLTEIVTNSPASDWRMPG
jgi:chemotaxis response regulator CheB